MNRLLLAALLSLPAAAFAQSEAPETPVPVQHLKSVITFASVSDPVFRRSLEVIIDCVNRGGEAALSAGVDVHDSPIVSLACTVNGEPATATMSSRHLAFYNNNDYVRAFRPALRVEGRAFGYGIGSPAPGGMPSKNWTTIASEHVAPAIRLYVYEREYVHPYDER